MKRRLSLPVTDFGLGAAGDLAGHEAVDPIQEADVYLAYGRDTQAEEILLDALKQTPNRLAVHLKLLEIYANRKAVSPFNTVAADLHAQTGGQGEEWAQAMQMGALLDSGNPLYGVVSGEKAVDVLSGSEQVSGEAQAESPVSPVFEPSAATVVMAADAPIAPAAPVAPEELPGSLDFDLDLGEAVESSASVEVEPVAAVPQEEVASLDFDLDLSEPVPAVSERDAPIAEAVESVSPSVEADAGLDFDLGDLGGSEPSTAATAALETSTDTAAEVPSADDGASIDFDFDLDLGAPSVEAEPAVIAVATETPAVASGVPELTEAGVAPLDFDFDLGEPSAPALAELPVEVPQESASAEPSIDFDFDLDLGDTETALATPLMVADTVLEIPASVDSSAMEAPAVEPGVPPLDLSSISLDLDSLPETHTAEAPVESASTAEPVEVENPEVATKLELAQAYEEMGDKEGARELFQEVLNEGTASQRAIAQDKLAKLG